MNLAQLFTELEKQDIKIWLENDSLKYKSPKGALHDDLKDLLIKYKPAIIENLQKNELPVSESPLSFNQQSLWFLHSLYPESHAYNVALAFRVQTAISMNALQKAYDRIISEQEVFRTTYTMKNESVEPVQCICNVIPSAIEVVDAAGWTEEELDTRIHSHYQQPFDLENGPVIRFTVFTISNDHSIFLFTIHHIACDAYSLKILLYTLFQYYSEYTGDKKLPENTKQHYAYTQFVKNQRHFLQDSGWSSQHLSFWQKELSGLPRSIDLPRDNAYPDRIRFKGASENFVIKDNDYKRIVEIAQAHAVSLNSVLLAVFQILLFAVSRQNDIAFGVVSSGRVKKEFLDQCGYFINPIVIRNVLHEKHAFKDFLLSVHNKMLDLLEHQEYPFSLLVEKMNTARDNRTTPLFQVLYNYLSNQSLGIIPALLSPTVQENHVPTVQENHMSLEGIPLQAYPLRQQEGQFEMTFEVIDTGSSLFITLKYNTDLFKPETIRRVISSYQGLLTDISNSTDSSLHELTGKYLFPGKAAPADSERKELLIAANFTIEPVAPSLHFWTDKLYLDCPLTFAPYNQVFQELLDRNSLFYKNSSGINIICLRLEEWHQGISNTNVQLSGGIKDIVNETKNSFIRAIKQYHQSKHISTFIICTPCSPVVAGDPEKSAFFKELENELADHLQDQNALHFFTSETVNALYPVTAYYEQLGEEIGHIPYTGNYFNALGTFIIRKFFVLYSKKYKVLVVDCDNTLWDGVVGEDGFEGITIGAERQLFQKFLLQQHASGMILCLSSKNEPKDVFTVFENHPDMILQKEHITLSKINWSLKSDNIHEMARELNLGTDSFIFIDDNPLECSEVESRCPGILPIRLPQTGIASFMKSIWIFDELKATTEDQKRADFYKSEIKREKLLSETYSFKDFIDKLELNITITDLQENEIPRASQLTYRVNQFNLKTIRMDEAAVKEMQQRDNTHIKTVHVKDRFADYGLVGLIIFSTTDDMVRISSFMLSCRALGKGVEHAMFASIGEFAQMNNLKQIKIEYSPTERNIPVRLLLDQYFIDHHTHNGTTHVYTVPSQVLVDMQFMPDASHNSVAAHSDQAVETKNMLTMTTQQVLNIAEQFADISNIGHSISKWEKQQSGNTAMPNRTSGAGTIQPGSQTRLHDIWKDILKHENFTIDDNFFDIGGKSILVPTVVIRLKTEYNIDVSIVDIFTYPTIRSLINYLEQKKHTGSPETKSKGVNKQKAAINAQRMRQQKARRKTQQE